MLWPVTWRVDGGPTGQRQSSVPPLLPDCRWWWLIHRVFFVATSHTYVHLAACGFLRQKCVWKGSGIYYYPWPTTHLCTYQAWHWPVPCMSIAARKMRFRSKSHQRSRKQRQISFCKERRRGPNFAASTIIVRSASQKCAVDKKLLATCHAQ